MFAQCSDNGLEIIGFESWKGQEIFLSSESCRLALGPTQFPIQRVPWIFPRGKVAGHDIDHSLHLVPSLRMSGATLPFLHIPSCHGQTQLQLYFFCKFLLKEWMKLFETTWIWQLYCCTTGILYDEIVCFPNLNVFMISPRYLNMTNL